MANLLKFIDYTRRFGLFRQSQFQTPVVYPMLRYSLPRRAILHYVALDGVALGPQLSDLLMRQIPGVIYCDHITAYDHPIGSPIKSPGANPPGLIQTYRQRNRAIRPLKNLERLEGDDRSLLIYNYSMLSHIVRYAVTFRAHYYQWFNVYRELVRKANELGEKSERQQFIEVELPEVMPGLTTLRAFEANPGLTSDLMKKLRTNDQLLIADLFLWAGEHRGRSLFGQIDPAHYGKINLIVRRLNGFVCINLGWLSQFRKGGDNKKGDAPKLFALKLLKLLTVVHQATSVVATPTQEEVLAATVEEEVEEGNLDALDLRLEEEEELNLLGSDELTDDDEVLARLEKELEELDRIKEEASLATEEIDEDGNITEVKTIDTELLQTITTGDYEGPAIVQKADELASKGLLTAADHRRLLRASEVYEQLEDPYGTGEKLHKAIEIADEDIEIKPDVLTDDAVVVDKSLAQSRVDVFDRQYITKVLRKDILRCAVAMQRAPIAITGYTIERETDASNDYEVHTLKIVPAVGQPSTVRFPIPVLKPDGTFRYNGTDYRMRKQRADLPIRKISPDRVGLTSYYAKLFVERSERKRFNYERWLLSQVVMRCLEPEKYGISEPILSKAVDYAVDASLTYTTLATRITAFTVNGLELWFDYKRREEKFGYSAEDMRFEKKGWVMCGRGPKGPLIMDPDAAIYQIVQGNLEDVGSIESLVGIELAGAPTSMAEVKIYSKNIPIGVALAYLFGLEGLLKVLKLKPRRVLAGERLALMPDEYAIRFKNESLIFSRNDQRTTLIMSGFNLYHAHIRNYDIGLFDEKDVYAALMDRAGVGARYLRELDSINTLFGDPITLDLLKWMKEPDNIPELLIRAVEMLLKDTVATRRKDSDRMVESLERVRGYERIAGTFYEVFSKAVRQYSARASTGRAQVLVNPNDVMNLIIKDPTTAPVNNLNPIHALREREVMTYGGRGGRSRRAMVASARLFTDEDTGFISEGTVDSGDVAIISYLSPNSNITSVRGTVRLYDKNRDGASSLMSTAALLAPTADGDDPKRVNFINVQQGHGIAAAGYECQALRTGMGRAIVSRMGPEFAQVAQNHGEVIEKSEDHIVVKYKDGVEQRVPLGLIHTSAEGSMYPNTLATSLEVGDKVKPFDVISYNTGFFKQSPFDPRRVDYMEGCNARIAIREATYTVEDSSSISVDFAKRMLTQVSKPKSVKISDFHQNVTGLVKVGDSVDLDTILCTIEDTVSSDAGLYDEATREALRRWSAMTPRAKVVGKVEKIEVFYNGDIEDMSESLQKIVAESEKSRKRLAKKLGVEYTTGYVPRNVRIDGANLEQDQAIIIIHITTPVGMGIGDKLVVGNQGKSTVGEILFGNNRTLEGENVDVIFGAKSFIDRIITSPFVNGTTNTLMRYIGESAYEMYFDKE